jgi:hypothetical protein
MDRVPTITFLPGLTVSQPIPSGVAIAVWDDALKNYGPNLGYDYGGRVMAAWLDR